MEVEITIPAQSVTIPSQEVSITVPAAQIVYQNSWLNQNSGFSTNFFTASQPGLFRVNAVVYCTSNPTIGAAPASVSVSVYDGNNNQLVVAGAQADAAGVQSSNSQANIPAFSVVGLSGEPQSSLNISATVSDPSHILNHFDLYVVVEQVI